MTPLAAAGPAFAFERRSGEARLAVALNAGDAAGSLDLGTDGGAAALLLATARARMSPPRLKVSDGAVRVELPPRSGAVIRLA